MKAPRQWFWLLWLITVIILLWFFAYVGVTGESGRRMINRRQPQTPYSS
jgi:hypothetical protein